MVKLAQRCTHCNGTGKMPIGRVISGDPKCEACGGTKYELTSEGQELRKFVLALLGDDDVNREVLAFVRLIRRDLEAEE